MNAKLLNVKINGRKVAINFVVIVFLGKLSCDVFNAFTSSEFGILVYKDFTLSRDVFTAFTPSGFGILAYKNYASSDTRYELSVTVSTTFSLLIKSLVSLTYDGICLAIG